MKRKMEYSNIPTITKPNAENFKTLACEEKILYEMFPVVIADIVADLLPNEFYRAMDRHDFKEAKIHFETLYSHTGMFVSKGSLPFRKSSSIPSILHHLGLECKSSQDVYPLEDSINVLALFFYLGYFTIIDSDDPNIYYPEHGLLEAVQYISEIVSESRRTNPNYKVSRGELKEIEILAAKIKELMITTLHDSYFQPEEHPLLYLFIMFEYRYGDWTLHSFPGILDILHIMEKDAEPYVNDALHKNKCCVCKLAYSLSLITYSSKLLIDAVSTSELLLYSISNRLDHVFYSVYSNMIVLDHHFMLTLTLLVNACKYGNTNIVRFLLKFWKISDSLKCKVYSGAKDLNFATSSYIREDHEHYKSVVSKSVYDSELMLLRQITIVNVLDADKKQEILRLIEH